MTLPRFVYLFDENRRTYARGSGATSGPIWIKHWYRVDVVGETRVSFILENDARIPKRPKSTCRTSPCYSWAEVKQREWAHFHSREIAQRILYSGFGALDPLLISGAAMAIGMPAMPSFSEETDSEQQESAY